MRLQISDISEYPEFVRKVGTPLHTEYSIPTGQIELFQERLSIYHSRSPSEENAYIVLIGGGASIGKSTLAWELAHLLGIKNVISTDTLRQAIREVDNTDPILMAETWEVWKILRLCESDEAIMEGLTRQAKLIERLFIPMTNYFLFKGMPTIVEGIHILPSLQVRELAKHKRYTVFFLDANDSQMKANYNLRRYSTHMRSDCTGFSNINKRLALHRQIIRGVNKAGMTVLSTMDWSRLICNSLDIITDNLVKYNHH